MKRINIINKFKHILNRIIINIVNSQKTVGRNQKFDNFFYLKYIFRILFYGDLWETFHCPKSIDRSTIRRKFYKWRDLGVFKLVYDKLFLAYTNNKIFKNLFIDATCIQNMNCSNVDICCYYKIKSKKQLKLSIISSQNNIPLCHVLTNPKPNDNQHIK